MKLISVVVVVCAVALALSAGALAGGSLVTGHSSTPPAASSLGQPPSKPSGTLPYTGVDLGLGAGVAALLVAAGVGLRRASRRTR